MSKSIADNAQRYFCIEISDPFHYYTVSNASVLVGPIFIDTVALTSQEFAGSYPPQSQVQGTMNSQPFIYEQCCVLVGPLFIDTVALL